jgi:CelD/BcsL family acetyltransferase involved in cellulose biosynthesis
MGAVQSVAAAAYEVRCWSEQQWLAAARECNELLASSTADPLFSSWDWQTLWWQHFGREVADDLRIYAFYEAGRLVGLAPFYLSRQRRKGVLACRSLQLIGSHWRDPHALISECLGLIAHRSHVPALYRECARQLWARDDWNELVIACTRDAAAWRAAFDGLAGSERGYAREVDATSSYQADLANGFRAYLDSLGGSTRRALWNLRHRLAAQGAAYAVSDVGDIEAAFAELNRLHRLRWGSPVFEGQRLAFHLQLAQRLAAAGKLRLAQTRSGARAIAVSYDIRIAELQYNVQLGFDAGVDARVSPGLLHLGFAMEEAAQSGVATYDFLAGGGQRSNYKANLAQRTTALASLQFLRGSLLSTLYRWHDRA